MENLPPGYKHGGVVYTVTAFVPDGTSNGEVALVVTDVDDEPIARQWFDQRELDNAPLAGPNVADWLRDVAFFALNSEGHELCADCGNPYTGLYTVRGHAPDCAYYDGEHRR
jgi:hypothetical protein